MPAGHPSHPDRSRGLTPGGRRGNGGLAASTLALAVAGAGIWQFRGVADHRPTADTNRSLAPGPFGELTSCSSTRGVDQLTGAMPSKLSKVAARLERIKADYNELRAQAAAELCASGDGEANYASAPASPAAAGTKLADRLADFGRELALLAAEQRSDLAALLTPAELEDFEMAHSSVGRRVQQILGATDATDEQRRAVFRLQRAFDEQFGLIVDVSTEGFRARDAALRDTQDGIRTVLGDALFARWLCGGRSEHESFSALEANAR